MNRSNKETHIEFYRRWGALAKPYFDYLFWQFRGCNIIGKRVGDVGCGTGNFVNFLSRGEIYVGFEPDQELAMEFRKYHAGANIKLASCGDICSPEAVEEIRANRLDTIICVNVLEHIKDDRIALRNMISGVSKGGHVCIIVPALPFLFGSLDILDNHYRRYTKKDLYFLIKGIDINVVKCHYINLLGAIGWFIKSRIFKENTHGNENFLITNALLRAIVFVESFIKPPIGMSLVMILKKRHMIKKLHNITDV